MAVLIAIDGGDHVGKSTFANNLTAHLKGLGKKVHYQHFPDTDLPSGKILYEIMKNGRIDYLNDSSIAAMFAMNRAEKISSLIWDDTVFIFDRYVLSNITYRVAASFIKHANICHIEELNKMNINSSILNIPECKDLIKEVYEMEHQVLNLPIPDVNFWIGGNGMISNTNLPDDVVEANLILQEAVGSMTPWHLIAQVLHIDYHIQRIVTGYRDVHHGFNRFRSDSEVIKEAMTSIRPRLEFFKC